MRRFDVVLEAWDAHTRARLATVWFDEMAAFSSGGRLLLQDEDEKFNPIYRLVDIRLDRAEPRDRSEVDAGGD